MSLFDTLITQALGAMNNSSNQSGSGNAALMDLVTGLVTGTAAEGQGPAAGGGLKTLLAAFSSNGLGEVAASWVSTGQNLPISAEQLQSVLGSGQIQAMAGKLGFSSADTAQLLSQLLPQVVDRLTPDGEVPEANLLSQGLKLLQGFGRS
jgi:uncharacterized protein YidB (DUF937 family)